MKSRFANMDGHLYIVDIDFPYHKFLDLQFYAILKILVLPNWHTGHL